MTKISVISRIPKFYKLNEKEYLLHTTFYIKQAKECPKYMSLFILTKRNRNKSETSSFSCLARSGGGVGVGRRDVREK